MMQIHFFSLSFSSQSDLCGLRFPGLLLTAILEFVAIESKLYHDLNLFSDSDLFVQFEFFPSNLTWLSSGRAARGVVDCWAKGEKSLIHPHNYRVSAEEPPQV
jgi:hypothetical protein